MNVFIKRAKGHENDILRVPETGRNLLKEGETVRWSPFWRARSVAGIIIVGREKKSGTINEAESIELDPPAPKSRKSKSSNKE